MVYANITCIKRVYDKMFCELRGLQPYWQPIFAINIINR